MKPAVNSVVDRNNELLLKADSFVYKGIKDGDDLAAHVFYPQGEKTGTERTAIIFFFSSSWDQGQVSQFAPQCLYFAERGAVSIVAEYRTKHSHGTGPREAMADARTALRWLRFNKTHFGLDEFKIVAAGGAAGAHLVASAAMIADFGEEDAGIQLSCAPNAMVLFSPILDISKKGYGFEHFGGGRDEKECNPIQHVRKGLPPALIFHGRADRLVPFASVEKFAKLYSRKKNVCELIDFEGKGHSFFNFNVDVVSYEATVAAMDRFLVDHGFLAASEDTEEGSRLVSWRQQEY